MSIGAGIFLFVVGAILTFALDGDLVSFVDINMVGYILMGAGSLIFILGIALMMRKRTSMTTTKTAVDPTTGGRIDQQVHSDTL